MVRAPALNYTGEIANLIAESEFFTDDLDANLDRITISSSSSLQSARASIWLYNEDYSKIIQKTLFEKKTQNISHELESLNATDFASYTSKHKGGSIVAVSNVYTDPLTKGIPTEYFDRNNIISLLDVPIWLHGELKGLLSCEHVGEERKWSEEEQLAAQALGIIASFCFEAYLHQEADKKLVINERRFHRALENVPDTLALYDSNLRLIFVNESARKLTGQAVSDLVGRTDEEIWPPEVYEPYLDTLRESVTSGEFREIKFGVDIPNIGHRSLHTKSTPLLDQDGLTEELVVVTSDLTQIEKSQAELVQSEKHFRALFENMTSGFVHFKAVVNTSGKPEDLIILSANEKFAETTGLNVQESIGQSLLKILPGIDKDGANWIETYGKVAITGESVQFEESSELLNKSYSIIAYQAEPNTCAVNFTDITERVRAETVQKNNLLATIQAISRTVEARDPYTAGHQQRVADIACAIASEMGLDADSIEGIRMGAEIHDIGKLRVPAEILSKPTKLETYEFELIKSHPQVGYDILKDIDFPWPVAEIAHQHHERLDGSGYPLGLRGEEICLEARIVAVADVVEAISSDRPYRRGLGMNVAIEEIKSKSGVIYDEVVVGAFLSAFDKKLIDM